MINRGILPSIKKEASVTSDRERTALVVCLDMLSPHFFVSRCALSLSNNLLLYNFKFRERLYIPAYNPVQIIRNY